MSEDKKIKMVNLQHDAHNLLDRLNDKLYQLDQWKKPYTEAVKDLNPKVTNYSMPYVIAEYMRTHIKEMRSIVNEFYNLSKEE